MKTTECGALQLRAAACSQASSSQELVSSLLLNLGCWAHSVPALVTPPCPAHCWDAPPRPLPGKRQVRDSVQPFCQVPAPPES